MTDTLRRIRDIIGNAEAQFINFTVYPDSVALFHIYEQEVPIRVDFEDNVSYVGCEHLTGYLTSPMLGELSEICSVIDNNIDVVKKILN